MFDFRSCVNESINEMEAAEYSCVIDVLKMHYEFFELLWYCTRGSEFVDYIFLEEVREYVAFQ